MNGGLKQITHFLTNYNFPFTNNTRVKRRLYFLILVLINIVMNAKVTKLKATHKAFLK